MEAKPYCTIKLTAWKMFCFPVRSMKKKLWNSECEDKWWQWSIKFLILCLVCLKIFSKNKAEPSRRLCRQLCFNELFYYRFIAKLITAFSQSIISCTQSSNHDAFAFTSNFRKLLEHVCILLLSWLRHCTKRRKVAGSIPVGVIAIFHSHNPFGRTMALGSTQPLKEMSSRNISWGVKAAGA